MRTSVQRPPGWWSERANNNNSNNNNNNNSNKNSNKSNNDNKSNSNSSSSSSSSNNNNNNNNNSLVHHLLCLGGFGWRSPCDLNALLLVKHGLCDRQRTPGRVQVTAKGISELPCYVCLLARLT